MPRKEVNQAKVDQTDVIGIMGAGVVGGSLLRFLQSQGRDVRVFDPPKGFASIDAIDQADIAFICVPTPYTSGVGFDDSFLHDAVGRITGRKLVVIKSTVLPGTTELLQDRYPQHRFMFNPEFLREVSAYEDFIQPDRQIIGCTAASRDDAERVMSLLPRAPFERICAASEAEMAKYVANSFLAVKVSYANEIFDLCQGMRIDYAQVRDMVAADARIGASHMDVYDAGYRGYGGKCLPKDSKSLLDLAESFGVGMRVLAAADRVNFALRNYALPEKPITRIRAVESQREIEERAA
jgi:UDPglucose 6-dehydrogenase